MSAAMSRHISRKKRWSSYGPNEHRSAQGRVYYRAGQWWAILVYQVADPSVSDPGAVQYWEVGRFKRARNAMIALEDKATELQRRYGDNLVLLESGR
jgi:hypothetical protein